MAELKYRQLYNVYLVCFRALSSTKEQVESLTEAIKKAEGWAKCFDNCWFIATQEKSAKEVWNRLSPCVAKHDYLLVIETKVNRYGTLPKKTWEWFRGVDQINSGREE